MKDIPVAYESREYVSRADSFGLHLKSMHWQKVRQAMIVNGLYPFQGLTSVVLGIKPAFVFGEEETSKVDFTKFVPSSLRNEVVLIEKKGFTDGPWYQAWLVDVGQVKNVFNHFPKYFPDTIGVRADRKFVESYIGRLTTVHDASAEEQIKTGLILGYPLDSVLSFSYEHLLESFEHRGFQLGMVKSDTTPFRAWLDKIYKESGMDGVLNENAQRLEVEWTKHVAAQKETLELVRVGSRKFLELRYADVSKNHLGVQFVPLGSGKLTGDDAFHLLNIFGKRYDVPQVKYNPPKGKKWGEMGVMYEGFLEIMLKSSSKKRVAYLTKQDFATSYKPGIEVIDRSKLVAWLGEYGRKDIAALLT